MNDLRTPGVHPAEHELLLCCLKHIMEDNSPVNEDEGTAWDLLTTLGHGRAYEHGQHALGPDVEDVYVCGHCKSTEVIVHDAAYVCATCNAILGRFIDQGAEWRTFAGSENAKQRDPSRCGLPVNELMPQGSMSTFVGTGGGGRGNYRDLARISKYQLWGAMPYRERSLFHAIDQLTVKAVNSGISQAIIDEAKVLYKRLTENCVSRGENRSGLLASSVYVACKNNKVPRSAKEIAVMFGIDAAIITRNCKKFQEVMHLRLCSSSPNDFVMRFCTHLKLSESVQRACIELVDTVQKQELMRGSSPPSVVAGCIAFLVGTMNNGGSKDVVSKKDVAEVCGVSEVTIAKCIKKLQSLTA